MTVLRLWSVEFVLAAVALCAPTTTSDLESARRLLSTGRIGQAQKIIRQALVRGGESTQQASLQATLGDTLFHQGDFEDAACAYRAALAQNAKYARAWWGLGRIELAQFHRKNARDFISRAFGLDPRDPDIILSYLEFAGDAKSRSTLLHNLILLTRQVDLHRAEQSQSQLELEESLHWLQPARMTSRYMAYTVRLENFQPRGTRSDGLPVPVSINGGKTLHLLLDSGARGITIAAREARHMGLDSVSESQIAGLGSSGPMDAAVTIAKSVAIGDLRFENCVVEVTRDPLTRGADGVMGMNLLEAFRIRLDARNKTLQLTPFADRLPAFETVTAGLGVWSGHDRNFEGESAPGAVPVYGFQHFLLVRTKANGRQGLFLVDTGSAFTTLAREFAPPTSSMAPSMSLHGAGGDVSDAARISPVTLEIAGRKFVAAEPVAMDLGHISQRQGIRISGILGYSALSRAPVTFNYRDGLVDLGDQH
jgi:predicted aspartyl protease